LLVANKLDLLYDGNILADLAKLNQEPVTAVEGEKMAALIGADYLECFIASEETLHKILETAEKIAKRKEQDIFIQKN
jgi:hypothetical protein